MAGSLPLMLKAFRLIFSGHSDGGRRAFQTYGKASTLAGLTSHEELSTMIFNDCLGNCQPQSDSSRFGREKGLE
jgi:hypothetical protein